MDIGESRWLEPGVPALAGSMRPHESIDGTRDEPAVLLFVRAEVHQINETGEDSDESE